jgi:hypothetical protein
VAASGFTTLWSNTTCRPQCKRASWAALSLLFQCGTVGNVVVDRHELIEPGWAGGSLAESSAGTGKWHLDFLELVDASSPVFPPVETLPRSVVFSLDLARATHLTALLWWPPVKGLEGLRAVSYLVWTETQSLLVSGLACSYFAGSRFMRRHE